MDWLRGGQFAYACQNLVYAEKRKERFSLLKASLFYYETSCLSSMSYSANYNRPSGWQDLISSISCRSCEFWDSILKKTMAAYYLVSVPIFQTDEIYLLLIKFRLFNCFCWEWNCHDCIMSFVPDYNEHSKTAVRSHA